MRGGSGSPIVLPLLATHILWINLVSDGAPALALGVDPADAGVMSQPPRARGEGAITGRMWAGIVFVGMFSNRWLGGAVVLSLALQAAVVYVPFLQKAFSTVSLGAGDWLRCAVVGSSVLWLREASKIAIRARAA